MFLVTAIFIGTFLEVLVYGAYVATFIKHIQVLAIRRRKLAPWTFIYLSTASLLLFVIATVAIVVDLIFTTHIFKSPTDPVDFSGYGRRHSINSGCALFAMAVSDAFLVYRSYILYNTRLRVVAIPLLVLVIQFGVGIWGIISLREINDDPWTEHPQKLTLAETIFGFISLAVNLICTGLIIVRLWRSHRQLSALGLSSLQLSSTYVQVGAVIINSAAINIVWLFSVFATSAISSVVYEVFGNSFACVTALIFSTIIVSASNPPSSEPNAGTRLSFLPRSFPASPTSVANITTDNIMGPRIQPVEFSNSLDKSDKAVPLEEV
ncbi:hypothetical protein BDP27DRAFT_1311915 [Rhodocollybia butyracea]|uniref:Uncharacterized protein n=1 Tax=Rhodocollybia butyracea TaxID=206335 RepID=A0A9P5Q8Z3_9AGAR|nr:hypothetical protein BDP27DRAFT_1311915 [Rhodocollybia butyracea]